MLLPLVLMKFQLVLPVKLLLQRVEHVVYVDRDALALVRVLQRVPSQRALHVNR
jgi:hypothetical protein